MGTETGLPGGTPTNPSRRGMDRRTLIRRAAVAGAAAWTAPVILGSVASPAGALTVTPGCYRMWTVLQGTGTAWGAWQATDPGAAYVPCSPDASECTETDSIAFAACVSLPTPVPADDSGTTVTITVAADCNCTIAAASAAVQTDDGSVDSCRSRDTNGSSGDTDFGGLGTKTVTINPDAGDGDQWDNSGTQRSTIGIVLYCV